MIHLQRIWPVLLIAITACDQAQEERQHVVPLRDLELGDLLKPADRTVMGDVRTITPQRKSDSTSFVVTGTIDYDQDHIVAISSRVPGRVERLHVNYNFEPVRKGQRLLDLYSPELVNAQQEFLFVLKNDPENSSLREAARRKLMLLGVPGPQIERLEKTGEADQTITLTSPSGGHIHEGSVGSPMTVMPPAAVEGSSLLLKEGSYVEMGQTLFTIYDPDELWVELNVPAAMAKAFAKGSQIQMTTTGADPVELTGTVISIDPQASDQGDLLLVRVAPASTEDLLPGQLVRASIASRSAEGWWLPSDAVIALGSRYVVFKKLADGIFQVAPVEVLEQTGGSYRIGAGLDSSDHVAARALLLIDNDSFIHADPVP